MVTDKFNMVDMGGIDLIMMQGEAVPGLHEKLMAAISNCQYQCLYNWLFDGVLIPPSYVQLEDVDNEIFINEGVSVTSDDVIHIYSIEPPAPEPTIIALLAEENGVYNVPSGVDGFNPVTVEVPSISMLTLDRDPTPQDGNVGDYCITTIPAEFDAVGVEILVAARSNDFTFNYYGTASLRLTLKDNEDNLIEVTDLSNASFYISSSVIAGGTNATGALTSQPSGYYYERNGLPGYFKISATGIGNYIPVSLEFSRRSGTAYPDYISTFNIILIKNNEKIGVLKSLSGLTLNDWPSGQRVAFTDFSLPVAKKLFYKTELGWVQII